MKRVLPLLSALLLLLSACAGGGFSATSVSLRNEGEALVFSFIPDRSSSYTLILRSPDGELEWNSPLSLDDPYMVSDELRLSHGASFPEGEYTWFVMNEEGLELTGKVAL